MPNRVTITRITAILADNLRVTNSELMEQSAHRHKTHAVILRDSDQHEKQSEPY